MRRCHHCDIVLCCNELSSEVGRLAQQRNAAWVANGGAVGNRDAIGICQLCRLSLSVCECVLVAATELARLRRMADAYAKEQVIILPDTLCWYCKHCKRSHIGSDEITHAATCDVATHLDLLREKGEGE